jgi:ComEC/Rec2-related protein
MPRFNLTALPIAVCALALVAGEICGFAAEPFAGLWAWAAFVAILAGCIFTGWNLPYGGYVVAFLAGLALAWHCESRRIAVDVCSKTMPACGGAPVFVLKVEGDASVRVDKKGRRMVSFASHMENVPVKVIAPLPPGVPIPRNGELWRCGGWLSMRKGAASRYSRRTLWATERSELEKISDADARAPSVAYRRLSGVLARRAVMGAKWAKRQGIAPFVRAMLLGRKEGISHRKLAIFSQAGTVHVFAISGLHVMLIAGILSSLMKAVGMSRQMCAACAIPALSAYVMLIGAPPSAVRAAIMASLYLAAGLFSRKPDSLAAWGLALIAVCAVSPEMILNVGCVLSFAVMLAIVLWLRWSGQFASPVDCLLRRAELAAKLGYRKRQLLYLRIHKCASKILSALGISLAAWIAGAPIAARVFGNLAFGGILANVAVVPIAGAAVSLGVLGIALSFVMPLAGVFFGNLCALCVLAMSWISGLVASVRWLSAETLPWSWVECLLWYVAWGGLFGLLSRYLPRRELDQNKMRWNGDV